MTKWTRCALVMIAACLVAVACDSPPVENKYRKEGRFEGGVNVPVVTIINEWAGKPKTLGSGWLIDGAQGVIFSAKHVTDTFMGDIVELGGRECKAFMNGRVYDCSVAQVPPLRDAVILNLRGSPDPSQMPKPYKIATEAVRVGEKVFIQGFHPHPPEVTESNRKDGLEDKIVPIFRDFYQYGAIESSGIEEIVFDSLEAKVVSVDEHINVNSEENDPLEELKYGANEYIKVITTRNHKFSFGGLSGGVVLRVNKNGEPEAVGIVTAERPVRWEYDKKGKVINKKIEIAIADTILITPIHSVRDLYEYARTMR